MRGEKGEALSAVIIQGIKHAVFVLASPHPKKQMSLGDTL